MVAAIFHLDKAKKIICSEENEWGRVKREAKVKEGEKGLWFSNGL